MPRPALHREAAGLSFARPGAAALVVGQATLAALALAVTAAAAATVHTPSGSVAATGPSTRTGTMDSPCSVRSPDRAPTVVELFTSEGCSSCPPADRWLSTLKGRADVLALKFHVTYWDRLGWPDRFASADYTQRQYDWARLHGSRQVYTPQAVVNGSDWRRWPQLPAAGGQAPVSVRLTRHGDQVLAEVGAASGRVPRLAGFWAVLEDGHQTHVGAGENDGRTLRHDHVVRLLRPVPAWAADAGHRSRLAVTPGAPTTPRRVAFVVVDAATQRPVQAVALAC